MTEFTGASHLGQMQDETQAFTPVWDEPAPPARDLAGRRRDDQPCRCDEHKYGQRPGTGAVLYSGEDVVYLMERAAIRDGRYEDTEAFGVSVTLRAHADFDAAGLHVRQTLAKGARQIAQMRGAA